MRAAAAAAHLSGGGEADLAAMMAQPTRLAHRLQLQPRGAPLRSGRLRGSAAAAGGTPPGEAASVSVGGGSQLGAEASGADGAEGAREGASVDGTATPPPQPVGADGEGGASPRVTVFSLGEGGRLEAATAGGYEGADAHEARAQALFPAKGTEVCS